MKYLVTGAAGFVGSHLCELLRVEGDEVIATDNVNDYYSADLKNLRIDYFLVKKEIEFIKGDLSDLSFVRKLIAKYSPDCVIHLAGQAGIRIAIADSYKYVNDNLVSFCNVAQVIKENAIPLFLYASSSSVYGNSANIPYKESDLEIQPISIYGATKKANEILASVYALNSATRTRGMRFFTVYGPWGRPDMAYFRLIESALNGSKFKMLGNGDIKRDFTFIDDNVRMIKLLAEQLTDAKGGYSDIVNIGGGKPRSLIDLVHEIERQTGKAINIEILRKNPNDTILTCADVEYSKNLSKGFIPEVELEIGIRKCLEWAKQSTIKENLRQWIESTV